MLIVLEGADGCGKSTLGRAVAKAIKGDVLEFPDDNAVTGPLIRSYLRKEWYVAKRRPEASLDDKAGALAFQALQVTNRMEHMERIAKAKESLTDHLVLVRYWQSAWVYGQLDGLDPKWLVQIHAGMVQADLNILLHLDAKESMRRRAARDGNKAPERYEGVAEFTQKVIDLYVKLWHSAGGIQKHLDIWRIIDVRKPIQNVSAEVTAEVMNYTLHR